MTFSFEDDGLPKGWFPVTGGEGHDLRESFITQQPRIALLTQLDLTVVARDKSGRRILVGYGADTPRYIAAHLTGHAAGIDRNNVAAVTSAQDLVRFLAAAV